MRELVQEFGITVLPSTKYNNIIGGILVHFSELLLREGWRLVSWGNGYFLQRKSWMIPANQSVVDFKTHKGSEFFLGGKGVWNNILVSKVCSPGTAS